MTRETVRVARRTVEPGAGARVTGGSRIPPGRRIRPIRRINQEYLGLCESLSRMVDDLDVHTKKWQDAERARFVVNIVMSALAPTNFLPTNPAALKRAFDTGGRSLVRGRGPLVA